MTRYEIEDLKRKEREGTITRKELRKLKAHRKAGGKTADTYEEKHKKDCRQLDIH